MAYEGNDSAIRLKKTFSNNQITLHARAAFGDIHIYAEPAFAKTAMISSVSVP